MTAERHLCESGWRYSEIGGEGDLHRAIDEASGSDSRTTDHSLIVTEYNKIVNNIDCILVNKVITASCRRSHYSHRCYGNDEQVLLGAL